MGVLVGWEMSLLDFVEGGCIVSFKGVTFCWRRALLTLVRVASGLLQGYFVLRGSVEAIEYFFGPSYA